MIRRVEVGVAEHRAVVAARASYAELQSAVTQGEAVERTDVTETALARRHHDADRIAPRRSEIANLTSCGVDASRVEGQSRYSPCSAPVTTVTASTATSAWVSARE